MKITIKKKEFQKLYNIACETWKLKFDEKFKNQLFSDDLEFEVSFLNEMQKACTKEQSIVFEKIFKSYIKEDLFSKIKNIDDIYKELNRKKPTLKDYNFLPKHQQLRALNTQYIRDIEDLLNNDSKTNLYYPYFREENGGLVFVGSCFGGSCYYGAVGLFKDQKTSDFVGMTFIDIYKIIGNI